MVKKVIRFLGFKKTSEKETEKKASREKKKNGEDDEDEDEGKPKLEAKTASFDTFFNTYRD